MTDTTATMVETRAPLGRYVGWYSLYYIGCMAVFVVISLVPDVDLGRAGTFVPTIVASIAAGNHFVARERRNLTRGEKWTLAFYCLLASYAASLIGTILVFGALGELSNFTEMVSGVPVAIWVVVLVIILPIQFGMTGLFLGAGAKSKAKSLPAQNVEKVFE